MEDIVGWNPCALKETIFSRDDKKRQDLGAGHAHAYNARAYSKPCVRARELICIFATRKSSGECLSRSCQGKVTAGPLWE